MKKFLIFFFGCPRFAHFPLLRFSNQPLKGRKIQKKISYTLSETYQFWLLFTEFCANCRTVFYRFKMTLKQMFGLKLLLSRNLNSGAVL